MNGNNPRSSNIAFDEGRLVCRISINKTSKFAEAVDFWHRCCRHIIGLEIRTRQIEWTYEWLGSYSRWYTPFSSLQLNPPLLRISLGHTENYQGPRYGRRSFPSQDSAIRWLRYVRNDGNKLSRWNMRQLLDYYLPTRKRCQVVGNGAWVEKSCNVNLKNESRISQNAKLTESDFDSWIIERNPI